MGGRARTAALPGGVLLAALAAVALLAPAAGGTANGRVAALEVVEQPPAAVAGYWTRARMRAAAQVGPGDPLGLPEALLPRSSDASASAFSPGNERKFPNRVHGKVFATYPITGDFSCSATVVGSPSRSLVVSAGHCIHLDGSWASNWMFVPGYRNGSTPFGRWPATKLRAAPPWVASQNISFDLGMATVARNARGRPLQDVVGARGIAFNQPRRQTYKSYGYPAAGRFDGESLQACRSPYTGADEDTHRPRTMSIECEMNEGSSGGGWVVGRRVLSVNSYYRGVIIIRLEDRLFGPYFGNVAKRLYRSARGRRPAGANP
jgi:hypothetical protein